MIPPSPARGTVAGADNWRRGNWPASHRYRRRFLPRAGATQTLASPVMAAGRPTTGCVRLFRQAVSRPPRSRPLPRRSGAGSLASAVPHASGGLPMPATGCSRPWPPTAKHGPHCRLFRQAVSRPLRSRPSPRRSGARTSLPPFPTRLAVFRCRPPSAAPAVSAGVATTGCAELPCLKRHAPARTADWFGEYLPHLRMVVRP
jgi:hypothetical protein